MGNLKTDCKNLKKHVEKKKHPPILDFFFPSSIRGIKETRDSKFLVAHGEYPPQVRCFDLENLSMKFERHVDSKIIDFELLSSDWEKILFLRSDKFLEFHSKSGRFYQTKLQNPGNNLLFNFKNNNVYISSTESEILRLNLQEGKFLSSLNNNSIYGNKGSAKNSSEDLLAFGNTKGIVNFWDPRITKKYIAQINGFNFSKKSKVNSVNVIHFDLKTNYKCFIGFDSGETMLFDLRCCNPVLIKDFGNNIPIKSIQSNLINDKILTSDSQSIKIWDQKTGKTNISLTSTFYINQICNLKNTGFIFIATQSPCVEGVFLEDFGDKPTWYSEKYSEEEFSNFNFETFKKKKRISLKRNYSSKELSGKSFFNKEHKNGLIIEKKKKIPYFNKKKVFEILHESEKSGSNLLKTNIDKRFRRFYSFSDLK